MTTYLSRRAFIGGATAGAAVVAAAPVFAISDSVARGLVERMVADINGVIASGASESAMLSQFETIFRRYADTSYVAAYAMGADARRASAAQKRAFSDAFNAYIARKYGRRFREFINGEVRIEGVQQRGDFVEVEATAYLSGRAPMEVLFRVWDRSGEAQFFNIYIEGVNMLLSERTEVGAILDRRGGDIDAMIATLRQAS